MSGKHIIWIAIAIAWVMVLAGMYDGAVQTMILGWAMAAYCEALRARCIVQGLYHSGEEIKGEIEEAPNG